MPLSPAQLTEIGQRFITSMNSRDYPSARSLYAEDATYESAGLVVDGHPEGRIVGREQIFDYFRNALDGDETFQLAPLDHFTGLNMVLIISSEGGRTFIDILRTDDVGRIVEHSEVAPKRSPINGPAATGT